MTQTQSSLLFVVIGASVLALIFAIFLARWVLSRSRGTPEMQKISNAIQQGAEAYLARQYKTISILSIVVAALLGIGYGRQLLRLRLPGNSRHPGLRLR